MVPTLDGDLEIGAHVQNEIAYLICKRHSFKSKVKKACFPSRVRKLFWVTILKMTLEPQVDPELWTLLCKQTDVDLGLQNDNHLLSLFIVISLFVSHSLSHVVKNGKCK